MSNRPGKTISFAPETWLDGRTVPLRSGPTPQAPNFNQSAQLGNQLLGIIDSQVTQALAYADQGQTAESGEALKAALTLAATCQFQHLFTQRKERIVPLLQHALRNGVTPDYAGQLLETLGAKGNTPYTGKGALVEPLSSREVEILQLVSDGLRNKDIAEQLSISLSTVKAHLYNIFSKLQSRSRTEAVSQGRTLGILRDKPARQL